MEEEDKKKLKVILRSSRKQFWILILWLVGGLIIFVIFEPTINIFPWNLCFVGIWVAGGKIIGYLQDRMVEREIRKKERRKLGLSEEMD